MQTINDLPPVPEGLINIMKKNAEQKMMEDGVNNMEDITSQDASHQETRSQETRSQDGAHQETMSQEMILQDASHQDDNQEENQVQLDESGAVHQDTWHQDISHQEEKSISNQTRYAKVLPNESFKQLRQKAQKAEYERDEAIKLLRQMQNQEHLQDARHQDARHQDDIPLKDDDLVDGKHLNKVDSKLRNLEAHLYEDRIQSYLTSKYPDFHKVVCDENINILKDTDPELAMTIGSSPDLYNKAVAAYKIIKNLGIYKENNYEAERKRVELNATKPRPLNSIAPRRGESPLGEANKFENGLTEELKKNLLKEMVQSMKGL